MTNRYPKAVLLVLTLVSLLAFSRPGEGYTQPRFLHTFKDALNNFSIFSFDYSMDGRKILVGYDGFGDSFGEVFDALTFQSLARIPSTYGTVFEPSASQVLVMEENGEMRLLDWASGEEAWRCWTSDLNFARFSPRGKYLLFLSRFDYTTMSLWDWAPKHHLGEFTSLPFVNAAVEFTPNESALIIVESEHSPFDEGNEQRRDRICIYDVQTRQLKEIPVSFPKPLNQALAVLPGGEEFICAVGGRTLYRCRYPSGEIVESFPHPSRHGDVTNLQCSPNGKFLLISNTNSKAQIVNLVTKTAAWEFEDVYANILFMDWGFSPDSRRVCLPSSDRKAYRVWDINGMYDPAEETPTAVPLPPTPTETPTPSPSVPPSPTPVPGWFVLDGFGGIHSTNAKIQRPILPYIEGFNIIRDLEPDPLGRGWYLLDGFGGVHTSSPDLPLPRGLPYFPGFDIARNLEVRQKGDRLEFYLLDGFGTVHSTDPDFAYGSLPWFGWDIAQDLDYSPEDHAWRVMDRFGLLFHSDGPPPELPLGDVFAIPGAKSIVRFADGTSVLLDAFGGRHTDPAHPAHDVVDGLPKDFYFPGWDIIWDLELMPQAWAENRE